jgi:histidinol-phosphate aminotransferase
MISIHKITEDTPLEKLLLRPEQEQKNLAEVVKAVYKEVKTKGDEALVNYTKLFDKVSPNFLRVPNGVLHAAANLIDQPLQEAIQVAKSNIEYFHRSQMPSVQKVTTSLGVTCWSKPVPIERVGLYIPGGSAPLFSSVLMLAVPAMVAGCRRVVLCTPPDKEGNVPPVILYCAAICGIEEVYAVGGSQAIAAMVLGTETIPKVDKIFGPGNAYVTEAKMQAIQYGVAIDLPAGPSEVMIMADDSANPRFVAADMLAQMEHGADSQAVVICESDSFARKIVAEAVSLNQTLPRAGIIREAAQHSRILVIPDENARINAMNDYAAEHLIIQTREPDKLAEKVVQAGSVFIGQYTPESAGDYASGTNHTLPTYGFARAYSGVNLGSYVKMITFQSIDAEGVASLGPVVELMAKAESLDAHALAMTLRMEEVAKGKAPNESSTHEDIFNVESVIRPHLKDLKPYSSARDEFTGKGEIWLDANENPFGETINRYPDPHQLAIKSVVSKMKGVAAHQIFLGNGSDECIDLLIKMTCTPGRDSILICPPTYGMYAVSARIQDIDITEVPLTPNFELDTPSVQLAAGKAHKLLFLCSPNNPSGNILDRESIHTLLKSFKGLVVIDEAYHDFSPESSWISQLDNYPNLVVLQTFSKAWGLAGARVGLAFANESIISLLDKIKPPYNISSPAQEIVLTALNGLEKVNQEVQLILEERNKMADFLQQLPFVKKVYPSHSNFILFQTTEARRLYDALSTQGVIVRDRSTQLHCEGCLRMTIGTPDENDRVKQLLMSWS